MVLGKHEAERRSLVSAFLQYAAASVLMVVPFTGTAFLGDQRRYLYMFTNETGGDPWRLITRTLDRVDFFLSLGNFRPLGRLFLVTVETMTLEAAMATGVPPHVLGGLLRLVMVAVLAAAAGVVVSALWRSAAAGSDGVTGVPRQSLIAVFALVLAMSLVASDLHAVMWFPAFLTGVIALVLVVPVLVASHESVCRRWSWRKREAPGSNALELVPMALLGSALVLIYDLAYVVPPLCGAMVVVRGVLARVPWRDLVRSAAFARLVALTVGFAGVFVPVRLAIAARCSISNCYWATDVVLSGFSPVAVVERLLAGFPPAGWRYTLAVIGDEVARKGIHDYLANWTTFLLVALLGAVTVRAFSKGLRPVFERESSNGVRMGLALIAVGCMTALLPALLVGLSKTVQNSDWPIGAPWRETLLVQVAWAFLLLGLLLVAASLLPSRLKLRWGGAVAAVVAVGLLGATLLTYYSNDHYARLLRSKPAENAVALVSASVVNFDTSEAGGRARCEVLRSYPRADRFGILDMLNELTYRHYGQPFCDAVAAGGYPSGFADDDGSPHEIAIDAMHAASILRGCADDPHRFCPDYAAHEGYAVWLINRLAWLEILEPGVSDLIGSDGELTRGDMAQFLVEASDDLSPVAVPQGEFVDIADSELAGYAEAVYISGIIEACADDPLRFCPGDGVTRGELVTMVARTFGLVPR